jgi:hypothetical protein
VFQPPEQVDAALPGGSSQPVIAAGGGGLLLIAFINGGQLFVVDRLGSATPYAPPRLLVAGASNPAISITTLGKAYLAFAAGGAGGHDVRAAYYAGGRWTIESAPLDAAAGDDAGVGAGRPAVAAAGDGVGIVAWGEAGHIYSRRVWGSSPSTVDEQADVPSLSGWNETAADQPVIGTEGDSSYADVAFHELLANGGQRQSRVLMRRLRASEFEPVTQPDGLSTPGSDGADQPQIATGEYGRGFVTSARDGGGELFATVLGPGGVSFGTAQVDSLGSASAPDGVPATAGLRADLIAWQHDPGGGGLADIRMRYSADGLTLGREQIMSSPALGPSDAADGLGAAGDVSGDAAVAWLQGTPGAEAVVVSQLYQPPGSPSGLAPFSYARSSRPSLGWSPARDPWGPLEYHLTVDGALAARTTRTSAAPSAPLSDGPHAWQVTAVNRGSLSSTSRSATVFIDTVPPVVRSTLTGALRVGSVLHLRVVATDAPPPPEPPADASGIADVLIRWGDGTSAHVTRGGSHVYSRPGRYRLVVIATDRAGNTTAVVQRLRIAPPARAQTPGKGRHR